MVRQSVVMMLITISIMCAMAVTESLKVKAGNWGASFEGEKWK